MAEFLDGVRAHLRRLDLAPEVLEAYPHELSGGMRQRIAIALATICRPDFIIADEPTTALDVVVQKSVLAMIRAIQQELGSSMLFVTHDMAVHANLTDRLGIMYAGRLVEEAATAEIFRRPRIPTRRTWCRACRGSATHPPSAAWRARRRTSPTRRRAAASIRAARSRTARCAASRRRRWSAVAPGHRVACFAVGGGR